MRKPDATKIEENMWIILGFVGIIVIAILFLKGFDRIAGRDIAHEIKKANKKKGVN